MAKETIITPIPVDHGFSHIKTADDTFPTAIAEVDIPITNDNIVFCKPFLEKVAK